MKLEKPPLSIAKMGALRILLTAQFNDNHNPEAYYIAQRWVAELRNLSQTAKQGNQDVANLERSSYSSIATYLAPFMFSPPVEGRATMNGILDYFEDQVAQIGLDLKIPAELQASSVQDLWNVLLQVDQFR